MSSRSSKGLPSPPIASMRTTPPASGSISSIPGARRSRASIAETFLDGLASLSQMLYPSISTDSPSPPNPNPITSPPHSTTPPFASPLARTASKGGFPYGSGFVIGSTTPVKKAGHSRPGSLNNNEEIDLTDDYTPGGVTEHSETSSTSSGRSKGVTASGVQSERTHGDPTSAYSDMSSDEDPFTPDDNPHVISIPDDNDESARTYPFDSNSSISTSYSTISSASSIVPPETEMSSISTNISATPSSLPSAVPSITSSVMKSLNLASMSSSPGSPRSGLRTSGGPTSPRGINPNPNSPRSISASAIPPIPPAPGSPRSRNAGSPRGSRVVGSPRGSNWPGGSPRHHTRSLSGNSDSAQENNNGTEESAPSSLESLPDGRHRRNVKSTGGYNQSYLGSNEKHSRSSYNLLNAPKRKHLSVNDAKNARPTAPLKPTTTTTTTTTTSQGNTNNNSIANSYIDHNSNANSTINITYNIIYANPESNSAHNPITAETVINNTMLRSSVERNNVTLNIITNNNNNNNNNNTNNNNSNSPNKNSTDPNTNPVTTSSDNTLSPNPLSNSKGTEVLCCHIVHLLC